MDQKDEIKSKVDLVEVIASYIPLKKAGRNMAALCPFHAEKTPSLMVSGERQVWKCFGCFPRGTLIKTPVGLHAIESIKVGDYVISGKGRPRRVLRTHKRYFQGRLIEVTPRKLAYPTSLTEDHQVYTLRTAPYLNKYKNLSRRLRSYDGLSSEKLRYKLNKYFSINKVYAGELSIDNYLLYPIKQEIERIESIDLSKYITRLNPKRGRSPRIFPMKVSLNNDFLKLLGYYLAEGSNHRAYIRFSLGGHEIKFAEEIVRLIKSVFNLDSSIHFRKGKKTGIEVTCCNSFLANAFENMCGKGAANKHIDYLLEVTDPRAQKILVDAILKGDGLVRFVKKSPNKSYSITTISKVLAEQIVDMLLRNEIFPGVGVNKEKIDKKGVNHKKAYTVTWYEKKEENYSMVYKESDGTKYWILPIRKIEERPFKGVVYNFTVDEDHSYVANNFVVGNCGEGGDVFTFVEKMEGWDFREALEELAKRAGVKLTSFKPSGAARLREKLITINNLALKFYKYLLLSHKVGAAGREYLKKRGIPTGLWEKFDLGFAPRGWETLWQFLTKRGFALSDIATAGLVIGRGAGGLGYYDRFRNRIMFPIKDSHGTVLGFAGRTIDPSADGREAKYINCPETPIFNKGSCLFGLDVARSAIREKNEVVLVEGEFDVLSAHAAQVFNAVASKGTALTAKQVAALSRLGERVILCFDTDLAGDAAARRGIELLDMGGMHVAVARLGKFKDPDQFAQKDGAGFKKAIHGAGNVYDYFIDSAIARFDAKTAEGKKKIGREVLPVLASISDDLVRAHYIGRLANLLDLETQFVAEAVYRKRGLGGEGQESQALPEEGQTNKSLSQEEYLAALVVAGETLVPEIMELLGADDFANGQVSRLWKFLSDIIKSSKVRKTSQIVAKLPQDLSSFVDNLYLVQVSPEILERDFLAHEIIKTAKMIKRDSLRRKLSEISGKLKEAELAEDQRQMAILLRHFRQISEDIKKVEAK